MKCVVWQKWHRKFQCGSSIDVNKVLRLREVFISLRGTESGVGMGLFENGRIIFGIQ